MHRLLLVLLAAAAHAAPAPPRQLALARSAAGLSASPGARAAYFVADITGGAELWTASAAGGWPAQLTETGGKVAQVALSPDGRSLVYVSDKDLFLVPTAGGQPRNLTRSPQAESAPSFSPDGRRLAYLEEDAAGSRQLLVRELESGSVRASTRGEDVRAAEWSPDGRHLAVLRGDAVLVLRSAGGEERVHKAGAVERPVALQWAPGGERLLLLAQASGGRRRLLVINPRSGRIAAAGPEHWDVRKALWRPGSGLWLLRRHAGFSSLYRLRSLGGEPERVSPFDEDVQDFALDGPGRAALVLYRSGAKSLAIARVTLDDARRAQWRRERAQELRRP